MARMSFWVGVSLLSFAAVGCVSQEKYNALKLDRDQYAERLASAERQAQASAAESDAYKRQLDAIMHGAGDKDSLVINLTSQIADLQRQNDELSRKYADAMNRPIGGVALPAPLDSALREFAAQNPDLVDFDSARGVVKFKSDVTFAAGSADVTPKAREAITRFSQILNSSVASTYELMVVGHTDNQRVVHEATIRAGHKDNWYLSAHRAIAVSEELQHDRVSSSRIEVAGFADQRPIASNATSSGQAQNRRVEVLILPTTVHAGVANTGGTAPGGPRRTARPAAFNKDSADVNTERKPAFNK